jgi:hypothetical protein
VSDDHHVGSCDGCGSIIYWCKLTTGGRMPLNRGIERFAAIGMVAFNPTTGGGKVLAEADLPNVEKWQQGGVRLHVSHFATCPEADQFRRQKRAE